MSAIEVVATIISLLFIVAFIVFIIVVVVPVIHKMWLEHKDDDNKKDK